MRSAQFQTTAEIIPFALFAARKARVEPLDSRLVPATKVGDRPVQWGSAWYHDEAVETAPGSPRP